MRTMRLPIALMTILPVALVCLAQQEPEPEFEKLGAFEVVRWNDALAGPEVELGGIKYELKEVQDLPVKQVLDSCRKNYPKDWRKAFEEDLVEVLTKLKKPPANGTLKIKVRPVEGGEDRTFEAVLLSEGNLESIIKNRQVVVAGAGGAVAVPPAAGGAEVKRVERQHAAAAAEPFKALAERVDPGAPAGREVLTRKQAEEDLDELEWHLVNRYAYLARHNLDYKAALDAVRASVGEGGVPRGVFALQLHRLLAIFHDGDTAAMLDLQAELPAGYLPFLTAQVAHGKVVAYDPGGAGLVDLDRPVLSKLDGVEIDKWLEAAKTISPGGSPQFVRGQCVENLRYVNFLRDRLKLPRKDAVAVELSTPEGGNAFSIEMKLADEPVRPPRPREGLRRTLEGNVGYLRLAGAADDGNFVRAMHEAMAESRGTQGLVIDVRRGGGAGRMTVRALFPYFADADDDPAVVNVVAYRLNREKNEAPDARDGYLADRGLFPITWQGWSDADRDAMAGFAKDFEPEWKPPALEFSAWHCAVVGPAKGGPFYRYEKPVVVLADAGSSGAAEVLVTALKGRKGVTVIGTPTAGATGRSEAVRLAHSNVPVRLCTTASFRPDGKLFDGRGVEPDVELWPHPNDFIGRTDSLIAAALQRIK